MPKTSLSSSLEDYLEAILGLIEERRVARAKDIAHLLQVKAASVTGALRTLAELGLINYEPYAAITLTPSGRRRARAVSRRHEVIRDFLTRILDIGACEADRVACRMEHGVSAPVIVRLGALLEFHRDDMDAERLLHRFRAFCRQRELKDGGDGEEAQ
jgi:DtxR family Mn-dependent transcriptional regulator